MSESFDLPIYYNGKDYSVEAKFIRLGYIHQFHVNIEGTTLIIEFDEKRQCRIIDPSGNSSIDKELIQVLVDKISMLHA